MKIIVDAKIFSTHLNTIAKIALTSEKTVTLSVKNKKFSIFSFTETNYAILTIPTEEVEGDFEGSLSFESLTQAIKGRSLIVLEGDPNKLVITEVNKRSKYKIELSVQDSIPIDKFSLEKRQEFQVSAEQGRWLRESIRILELKPNTLFLPFTPLFVSMTKERTFLSCFSNNNMSFLYDSTIQGDLNFILPTSTFCTVLDIMQDQSFSLGLYNNYVSIRNKNTDILMSIPIIDQGITEKDLLDKSKYIVKSLNSGNKFVLKKEEITKFIDNSKAIKENTRTEINVISGKNIKFEIISPFGKMDLIVKKEGNLNDFKIDLDYFTELLSKTREDFLTLIQLDNFIALKNNKNYFLTTVNQ